MTGGQVKKYIETGEEQGATAESIQRAYGSGIIAAALNPMADFSNMPAILKLLGLDARPVPVAPKPHLRLLSGDNVLMLPATDGLRSIALAKRTFPGHIDSGFTALDVLSASTGVTRIAVHELVRNSTFKDMFAGVTNFFNQDQVIAFVEHHAKWLHPKGWATFLPFTVGTEFFVADVYRYSDERLGVYVYPFASGNVWFAENRYRVVLPQLDASAQSS